MYTVNKMCQKNRHNYVSFDIDTNCVEIFIEKKEGGTKHFIKGIEYRQKNFSHQKSEFMESENRSRTSVKSCLTMMSPIIVDHDTLITN